MDKKLKKLKLKYSLNHRVMIATVVIIIFLVNVISTQVFTRFDWTDNNKFTISDFTIAMLQGVNDLITVKVYISENLPPSVQPVANQLRDILEEYEAYGNGDFQYRFVDPATDDEALSEVQTLGIQQIQMQIREKDRFETQRGYMGIGVFHGSASEVIPVVQNFENLEYELSSLILKLVLDKKEVGFLKGHGEHGIEALPFEAKDDVNDYSNIRKLLEKNYEVGVVDISDGVPIAGIDTLVVAGGNQPLSERDFFEIDQFIMNGGNVIFLVDKIAQTLGITVLEQKQSNINDLIAHYGFKVNTDMVMDQVSDYANFSSGGPFTFLVQYPPFVKVVGSSLVDHPIVSKIDNVVMRWVSSISTSESDGVEFTPLLRTSKRGWLDLGNEGQFLIDPNAIVQPAEDAFGQHDIAVLATGTFKSFFDSVPHLEDVHKNDDGTVSFSKAKVDAYRDRELKAVSEENTKIIVVSDSDFISDSVIRSSQSGALFFLNSLDFVTLGDGLIDIRAKNLGSPAIRQLGEPVQLLLKYLGILFIPIMLTLYGTLRFYFRRRR